MIRNFEELLTAAAAAGKRRALVVAPKNQETSEAIAQARDRLGLDFVMADSVDAAMELLTGGGIDILMKGSVDTATLMKSVLKPEAGLRTGRLLSDVFVFEYAPRAQNRLVMITDGGLNIAPDLAAKVELIRNAVEVAHALGNERPKVAALSASEFVEPKMPSSVDAARLAEMSAAGEIAGCVVEGPLALDGALVPRAAQEKCLTGGVAGDAEILLCPNIESANMLAKSTTYIANAPLAHVIVGARIPILIPSRADRAEAKLLSLALGVLMSGRNGL